VSSYAAYLVETFVTLACVAAWPSSSSGERAAGGRRPTGPIEPAVTSLRRAAIIYLVKVGERSSWSGWEKRLHEARRNPCGTSCTACGRPGGAFLRHPRARRPPPTTKGPPDARGTTTSLASIVLVVALAIVSLLPFAFMTVDCVREDRHGAPDRAQRHRRAKRPFEQVSWPFASALTLIAMARWRVWPPERRSSRARRSDTVVGGKGNRGESATHARLSEEQRSETESGAIPRRGEAHGRPRSAPASRRRSDRAHPASW